MIEASPYGMWMPFRCRLGSFDAATSSEFFQGIGLVSGLSLCELLPLWVDQAWAGRHTFNADEFNEKNGCQAVHTSLILHWTGYLFSSLMGFLSLVILIYFNA